MLSLKIFASLWALASTADITFHQSNTKSFVFDRFLRACEGYNNLSMRVSLDRVYVEDDSMRFDLTVANELDVKQPILFVEFIRCASKEAPDTCTVMSKMRSTLLCRMLHSEGDMWSALMSCLQPKLSCPIAKTTYKGTKCGMDMTKFKFFPLSTNYYMKFRATIYDKASKRIVTCLNSEGQLVYRKDVN